MTHVSLSVIVVAHNSLGELRRSLPPLIAQMEPDDELIVVDNASRDGVAEALVGIAPRARVLALGANTGFATGANRGADHARGDLLLLLNPDATAQPGFLSAIRRASDGPWSAWMGLVLHDGGTMINTSGGVLHYTGFGWAGQVNQPAETAPAEPTEVGFLSGACLAVPRAVWQDLGGFSEPYFMYCEDVDLSLRLRLRGARIAVVPDARVEHAYDFAKGDFKWRMLERNRWATILRTYPAPVLVAVLPALILAELGIWLIAIRGGWGRMKARATWDLVRWLPRLARERAEVAATVRVAASEFAAPFTPHLSSPYFGRVGRSQVVTAVLVLYWRAATAVIRRSSLSRARP